MEKGLGISTDLFLHPSQMPFIKKFFLSELWERQGMGEDSSALGACSMVQLWLPLAKVVMPSPAIPWPGICPFLFNPHLTLQLRLLHKANQGKIMKFWSSEGSMDLSRAGKSTEGEKGWEGSHLWEAMSSSSTSAQLPFSAVLYPICINQEKSFNLSHLLFCKMGYWYIPTLPGLAWVNP